MRKKIVAGNWKMNTTLQAGVKLAQEVEASIADVKNGAIVITCTPFTHLTEVKKVLKNAKLGAQNCADQVSGAYTGEISAEMVKSTGAEYVIIGHSERRTYYGETDQILNKKTKLALANNLIPIFCVGEVLAERESNIHFDVIKKQTVAGLFDLSVEDFQKIVIAYEPVWAIGTGKTASSEQAQEVHKYIRGLVAEKYGKAVADECSILYGGSCKASNAPELFSQGDIDGGLIGGAALTAADFIGIIKAF